MHLICLVSLKKEDVNEWVAMDVDDGLPWADGCGRWAEGLEWVGQLHHHGDLNHI